MMAGIMRATAHSEASRENISFSLRALARVPPRQSNAPVDNARATMIGDDDAPDHTRPAALQVHTTAATTATPAETEQTAAFSARSNVCRHQDDVAHNPHHLHDVRVCIKERASIAFRLLRRSTINDNDDDNRQRRSTSIEAHLGDVDSFCASGMRLVGRVQLEFLGGDG